MGRFDTMSKDNKGGGDVASEEVDTMPKDKRGGGMWLQCKFDTMSKKKRKEKARNKKARSVVT